MTSLAWLGLLIVAVCVWIAYRVGFGAGFRAGRTAGFGDGRKEGAREGSRRGFAVGFDRGRRRTESSDDDETVRQPRLKGVVVAALGAILAAIVLFSISRSPEAEAVIPSAESGLVEPSSFPPLPNGDRGEPSID